PSSTLFPYTTLFRSRTPAAEVEPSLAHNAYCVGMQIFRAATGAECLNIPRKMLDEGLGHLRTSTVASTQEQHANRARSRGFRGRSEEHTSELQSLA